ncbi:MAG: PP2C family serine/threonine-protein phosphatase [Acidobacteriota bacterium]
MFIYSLEVGAATDVGRRRRRNEDSYAVFVADPQENHPSRLSALMVVADGMGGERAGDRASQITAKRLHQWLAGGAYRRWPELAEGGLAAALQRAITEVGREIVELGEREPEVRGLGSTVVAVAMAGNQAVVAHVGDSRCYRVRGGQLERLTEDHSWVEQQVAQGLLTPEKARVHPGRNVLTRSLGDREPPVADVRIELLRDGDCYLLCSDGLTGGLDDDALLALIQSETDPQRLADRLVRRANELDGSDNITAVVGRCRKHELEDDDQPTQPLPKIG